GEAKLRLTRPALPLATPRAHDLVGLRLVAGDGVEAELHQFLDRVGARGLVLDQHDTGIEGFGLPAHRGFNSMPSRFSVMRESPRILTTRLHLVRGAHNSFKISSTQRGGRAPGVLLPVRAPRCA